MGNEKERNINSEVEKKNEKQYISFGLSAGICNRIKKLFSALRFNVDWEEPLDFYWSQGELINRKFYDLFRFDLCDFNEIPCKMRIIKENEYDVASDLTWRLKIEDGEVPVGFTKAYPKDDDSKEYIDFEYERIPLNVLQVYMRYFNALKPSDQVQSRIESVRLPENCVSVHLRQDRYWNEYGRGDKDAIKLYIDEMKKLPDDMNFFLAAANEIFAEQIRVEFPGRIIELPNKDFQDAIDAVAELYLLGKTKLLLATAGSSFSEVAWWLGGGKQEVRVIGDVNKWGVKCPICEGDSEIIRHYTRQDCIEEYKHLYQIVPDDLETADYEMMKCNVCGLVFANPMKSGSQSFYTWVTEHENYYPTAKTPRWEWQEIRTYVKENHVQKLLEVGCGTGEFLEYLRQDVSIDAVGLDTTVSSYEKCIQKGLTVYNVPLERYILDHEEQYDVVAAFHLLEHVENPLELVKDMMRLLTPEGKCILSFPYTDSRKIEKCMTTANNLPPHHLTFWEFSAIQALAAAVNADLEMFGPETGITVKEEVKDRLRFEFFPCCEKVPDHKVYLTALKNYRRTREIKKTLKAIKDIHIAGYIGAESVKRRPPWFVLITLSKKK